MLNIFMQAGGAAPKPTFFGDPILLVMMAVFLIFYFIFIRPQNKRLKDHKAMLSAVTRGDEVVTSGGLIGKVTKVTDEDITVDLGGGTKVKVVKSMLADIRNRTVAANDTGKGADKAKKK
jgi:preprotein translocase subunit YajC